MSMPCLIFTPGVVAALEDSSLARAPAPEGLEPADQPGQLLDSRFDFQSCTCAVTMPILLIFRRLKNTILGVEARRSYILRLDYD